MKGTYRIQVKNKKIRYDFEIKRNITIIKGDSATGKTTLVDMIREYYENGRDSGINLVCTVTCAVLEGRNWEVQLNNFENSILFIDEGNTFVSSKAFAERLHNTNNYFVIVTRESLPMLPYSVQEIYGIRNSGKYGTLTQTYNEMYHIYGDMNGSDFDFAEKIVTEDSNSGYQFFQNLCSYGAQSCISANGKSNLFSLLVNEQDTSVLVIADGAAIGSEMEKLMQLSVLNPQIHFYLPESFEWLILQSNVLQDKEILAVLENPSAYIESTEFLSWERFFTSLLIAKTQGTHYAYTKNVLNPFYTQKNVMQKILETIGVDIIDMHFL